MFMKEIPKWVHEIPNYMQMNKQMILLRHINTLHNGYLKYRRSIKISIKNNTNAIGKKMLFFT